METNTKQDLHILRKKRKISCQDGPNIISFNAFITLLKKPRIDRTPYDIKYMSDFLSANYAYFQKLKETSDNDKLNRIVFTLNHEKFCKGEKIINFGDKGDKFYILLQGTVTICIPIQITSNMTLRDYTQYLYNTKVVEENNTKFQRIMKLNENVDYYYLQKINFDYTLLRKNAQKQPYVTEGEKQLGSYNDGFAFGEAALITKAARNATIYATVDCILVSLDAFDYNSILKEIEKKRLFTVANDFKQRYPLLKHWRIDQIFRLFNYFSKVTISYGETLYKQNDPIDYIYFLHNGVFEVSTLFSFAWYEDFIEYIHDSSQNIIHDIHNRSIFDNNEKFKLYLKDLKEKVTSPCLLDQFQSKKSKFLNSGSQYDLLKIKLEQDDLMTPGNYYKVIIKTIKIPECIGFEDGLEYKPRFTTIKCLSPDIDIQRISLSDFVRILPFDEFNRESFQKVIFEKKLFLIQQLRNNALCKINTIDASFKDKYENAILKVKPEFSKPYSNDKKLLKSYYLHNKNHNSIEITNKLLIHQKANKNTINNCSDRRSVNIDYISRNEKLKSQNNDSQFASKQIHTSSFMPSLIQSKNNSPRLAEIEQYETNGIRSSCYDSKKNSKECIRQMIGKSTEYDDDISLKKILESNEEENKTNYNNNDSNPRLNKSKSEMMIINHKREKNCITNFDLYVKNKALNWSHKYTLPQIKASGQQSMIMSNENKECQSIKNISIPIKKTHHILHSNN